jgi:hypothetical protein
MIDFCICLMPLGSKTCHHCKKLIRASCSHENYGDYGDGMCYEGCCDRYQCKDCGKIWTEEGAD